MNFFSRLLYYGVLVPISLLPYRILYFLSDITFVLVFYVVRYRQKLVLRNIQRSFPEKSAKEHYQISRAFYRHFCDIVVESFKNFTVSKEEVLKRMVLKNPEVLTPYVQRNQSIIIAGGHYNNWELFAVAIGPQLKHQPIAIYRKLKNAYMDRKMRESRSKYGLKMISTKVVKEEFAAEKNNLTATIFGFDQTPRRLSSFWMMFLNQETPVFMGTERYAKEYNYPIVFGRITKVKRGYYEFTFHPVNDEPRKAGEGEIMATLMRRLERDIQEAPPYWLWTHKRWKHKRAADIPLDTDM